jgi:hypothetical protein
MSPEKFSLKGLKTYSELAEACFEVAASDGSILKGGLGISVFLRIKLSEVEVVHARDHLAVALAYARDAVRKAESQGDGKNCISILSSDAIGSRCLLVSVLRRLGKRNEAQKEANRLLEEITTLFESNANQDCSVMYGLAGVLKAIWFLRNELSDDTFGSECALLVSSSILLEGLEHSEKYRTKSLLMWEFRGKPFLGAGTGVAGSASYEFSSRFGSLYAYFYIFFLMCGCVCSRFISFALIVRPHGGRTCLAK